MNRHVEKSNSFVLFLFLLFFSSSVNASSWSKRVNLSVEAGMHISNFVGSVSNNNSNADFQDDFNYLNNSSSYFSLGVTLDFPYVLNFNISYFNDIAFSDATMKQTTYIADGVFESNTTTSSAIEYQVINFTMYQNFKSKGDRVKFLRWKFYPGDIEFNVGVNFKSILWKFQVTDRPTSSSYKHWIIVDEVIPLPYIGFQYYYYNLKLYGNISALSFREAKSTNYDIGLDYRLLDNLYINISYLFEGFLATEKTDQHIDTVRFQTVGNKIGFKYIF